MDNIPFLEKEKGQGLEINPSFWVSEREEIPNFCYVKRANLNLTPKNQGPYDCRESYVNFTKFSNTWFKEAILM